VRCKSFEDAGDPELNFDLFRRRVYFILILPVFLVLATQPLPASAKDDQPLIKVCKNTSHCVFAWIATSPETQERGLMYRDKLPEDRGMLFMYTHPDFWTFWMKNTKMPLDIIWLDKRKVIVFMVTEAQPCIREPCLQYRPDEKALYALELAAGMAKKWDIKTGDRLTFEIPKKILGTVK
jgi:uncharacterized membrane protein (UPF0127 family)